VTWALFLSSLGVSDEQRPALLDAIDKSERRKPEQTLESIEGAMPGRSEEILSGIDEMKAVSTFDALNERLVSFGEEGERRAGEWAELIKLLESHDAADCVGIDLSIVRGLAYYTGFVYEAFETSGKSRALAGGGRYDHLVKKLSGNVDLPAAGFAIGDVTLTDCLDAKKLLPDYIDAPEIFIVAGANERSTALRDVARLRQAGYSTAYPLKRQAFGKQFKEADRSGAKFAIVYGEEEVLANKVKIKDLSTGAEVSINSSDLLHNLRSLEESGGMATNE
jgi:histidyl-tRNA synthetase